MKDENPNPHESPIPPEYEALLSLVKSTAIHKAARRVPQHIWEMTTTELEAQLNPTDVARAIRVAFWNEVSNALTQESGIKISKLAERVLISYDQMHDNLTTSPTMLVWILRPISNSSGVDTIFAELLNKVSDIVRLSITDNRGRTNVRNARLILRAVEVLSPFVKNS